LEWKFKQFGIWNFGFGIFLKLIIFLKAKIYKTKEKVKLKHYKVGKEKFITNDSGYIESVVIPIKE
jgi:hypothetical protein